MNSFLVIARTGKLLDPMNTDKTRSNVPNVITWQQTPGK